MVSDIKWLTTQASQASMHPGQDLKKSVSPAFQGAWSRIQEHLQKACLKKIVTVWKLAGKEAASRFCPPDGTRACRPIGLDMRQLGLVSQEGKIVDGGNMKERVVPFVTQEYV